MIYINPLYELMIKQLKKGPLPVEIVGLYYYSAQLKDFETQYELFIKDDRHLQIPKDEYMNAEHQHIDNIRLEFRQNGI